MPIVACSKLRQVPAPRAHRQTLSKPCLVGVVELVIHEACDDAGLAHRLIAQKHLDSHTRRSSSVSLRRQLQQGACHAPACTWPAATRWSCSCCSSLREPAVSTTTFWSDARHTRAQHSSWTPVLCTANRSVPSAMLLPPRSHSCPMLSSAQGLHSPAFTRGIRSRSTVLLHGASLVWCRHRWPPLAAPL